jgi:hypothetical protein
MVYKIYPELDLWRKFILPQTSHYISIRNISRLLLLYCNLFVKWEFEARLHFPRKRFFAAMVTTKLLRLLFRERGAATTVGVSSLTGGYVMMLG